MEKCVDDIAARGCDGLAEPAVYRRQPGFSGPADKLAASKTANRAIERDLRNVVAQAKIVLAR